MMHYHEMGDTIAENAAKFILDNIKFHYFYDSKDLENYYKDVKNISKTTRYPHTIKAYQNLTPTIIGLTTTKVYDYEYLKAEDLIKDIDDAIF